MSRLVSWTLNCVYAMLLMVASPWIVYSAIRHGKYREGFAQKFLGRAPQRFSEQRCVWLHAVSVGEVNLLQSTLAALRKSDADVELVISTTTKTGYALAREKYADCTVFYCPLDFSWAVTAALKRVRPDLLVLAELELWPNLIRMANQRGTKVAIINGRLSDKSFCGYMRIRPLVARLLQSIELFAVQNEETADRFRKLGAKHVTVTGSLKFDGAKTDRDNPQTNELRRLAGFASGEIVLLAGSTQSPEEQYAIEIFQRLAPKYPQLRLVVVPRHPERFEEAARLLQQLGLAWTRRTELDAIHSARHTKHSAILIDSVGELGAWWGMADIGFVGGSFGSRGGQNMLEPAAYGVATCFGPNTRNFRDIVAQLLKANGAQVVDDQKSLEAFVERAITDRNWAKEIGQRARELVVSQQGATERTVELLRPLIDETGDRSLAPAA